MAQVDLKSLIDQLDDNIDDLEEALAPLLKTALSETAAKLPLLDRARLYVLSTYAIESLIFSFLRLNGVKAKHHPVFTEITRVKQYFEKLKLAEAGEQKRTLSLNKDAANRFIKHDLAKNIRLDAQASSALSIKASVHTRFPAETDTKPSKSKAITAASSKPDLKAKAIRDQIGGPAQTKTQPQEALMDTAEQVRDVLSLSSSSKRPRETEALAKSEKRKHKKQRRQEREAAAKEAAAT